MKQKLILWLSLWAVFVLFLHSCRQEYLPEQETHSNSSRFQLTSQRISLNDSKHKTRLLPELQKAEAEFKAFDKSNAQGKFVNYGNGTSIDTESVIYIENGPNYHTYTFNIKRDNAPADAPLENLLLSLLPDGSYQEFLVTYTLTAQEKEKIKNGEAVDTRGKVNIAELTKGTFNSAGQLAKMNCSWNEQTIWESCSEGIHNASNIEQWHKCKATTPPSVYTIATWSCTMESQPGHIAAPEAGPGNSGPGGGNAGTTPNNPDCTSVATNPEDVGIIDPNGCNNGVPTQPNMPDDNEDERTPCQILKDNSADPAIQSKIDSLKTRVALTTPNRDHHETAITITKRGALLKYQVFDKPIDIGVAGAVTVKIEHNGWDILAAHNHYEDTFPVPQFGDIHSMYVGYKILHPPRKNTYVAYTVNFNGTEYAFKMNDTAALDALFAGLNQDQTYSTDDEDKKARNLVYKIFEEKGFKKDKDYTESDALKMLMKVLNDSKIGNGNSVHLYRKNKNTQRWAKLKLKSDGEIGEDDCPL